MKLTLINLLAFLLTINSSAQDNLTASIDGTLNAVPKKKQQVIYVTGVRFAYPLVQKWIDEYSNEKPDVQLVIEARGSADPAKYDILVEGYEHEEDVKKSREYVYVARYAILPVVNSNSAFAKTFVGKGLNKDLINQLFFHDIYADKEKHVEIKQPYTIYTRLQKAGAPTVFAGYFGYQQKDVQGKAIAGADEHLLKAILRDSTGVSYLPLTLVYDHTSRKPVDGLAVLPVDLNGNGKVSDDEKIYDDLTNVIQQLENRESKEINNIPVEYLHLSVSKVNATPEAIDFLRWVITNGEKDLHDFGYLNPRPDRVDREKFEQFASERLK
jgi:ABC-type phosphate transport system substrate-binding protein